MKRRGPRYTTWLEDALEIAVTVLFFAAIIIGAAITGALR